MSTVWVAGWTRRGPRLFFGTPWTLLVFLFIFYVLLFVLPLPMPPGEPDPSSLRERGVLVALVLCLLWGSVGEGLHEHLQAIRVHCAPLRPLAEPTARTVAALAMLSALPAAWVHGWAAVAIAPALVCSACLGACFRRLEHGWEWTAGCGAVAACMWAVAHPTVALSGPLAWACAVGWAGTAAALWRHPETKRRPAPWVNALVALLRCSSEWLRGTALGRLQRFVGQAAWAMAQAMGPLVRAVGWATACVDRWWRTDRSPGAVMAQALGLPAPRSALHAVPLLTAAILLAWPALTVVGVGLAMTEAVFAIAYAGPRRTRPLLSGEAACLRLLPGALPAGVPFRRALVDAVSGTAAWFPLGVALVGIAMLCSCLTVHAALPAVALTFGLSAWALRALELRFMAERLLGPPDGRRLRSPQHGYAAWGGAWALSLGVIFSGAAPPMAVALPWAVGAAFLQARLNRWVRAEG